MLVLRLPGPGPGPLRTVCQVLFARIKITRSPSYGVPGSMCSYSDYQVLVPVPAPFVPCGRYYVLVFRLPGPGPGPGPGPLRTVYQVLCARIEIARSRSRSPLYGVPGTTV